ncbi:hypothetical protein PSEUDO8O_150430 [Pseudomonas sp. 8O]|nr:hypothetical protein PSEUDO8O_150430 [Pseudomonas sp. 8O]
MRSLVLTYNLNQIKQGFLILTRRVNH